MYHPTEHQPKSDQQFDSPTKPTVERNGTASFGGDSPHQASQRKMQGFTDNSPLLEGVRAFQSKVHESSRANTVAQLQPVTGGVVQFNNVKSNVFPGVMGPQALINIFDQLMNNNAFRLEVQAFLQGFGNFLLLAFWADHSRFAPNQNSIYINQGIQQDPNRIREELAFELHNATMSAHRDNLKILSAPQANEATKNRDKIKNARITEFTEWMNLVKMGHKVDSDGANMGFNQTPGLINTLKTHWITFEEYLKTQITMGHTQHYLGGVVSEQPQGAALNLNQRSIAYFRQRIPTLFNQFQGEQHETGQLLHGLGGGSTTKAKVNWASQGDVVRLKETSNLRRNNADKSVIRQVNQGEFIKIINRNRANNDFSLGFFSISQPHFWVETVQGQRGWVKQSSF